MSKIIKNGNMWYTQEQVEQYRKFFQKIEDKVLRMSIDDHLLHAARSKRNEDNRKWAYVFIGKTRVMCWVDNKTMKAYKADGYEKTWIEIKEFTFDRWCTGHDL